MTLKAGQSGQLAHHLDQRLALIPVVPVAPGSAPDPEDDLWSCSRAAAPFSEDSRSVINLAKLHTILIGVSR